MLRAPCCMSAAFACGGKMQHLGVFNAAKDPNSLSLPLKVPSQNLSQGQGGSMEGRRVEGGTLVLRSPQGPEPLVSVSFPE